MSLNNQDKKIAEIARQDWQEQCNRSLSGGTFRDKSAKACYERHKAAHKEIRP